MCQLDATGPMRGLNLANLKLVEISDTRNQGFWSCFRIWDMALWNEPNIELVLNKFTVECGMMVVSKVIEGLGTL